MSKEAGKGPAPVPGHDREKYKSSDLWCINCDKMSEKGSVFCKECNQQLPERVPAESVRERS